MEKRYIFFMVLSMGMMMGYVALDMWLYPEKFKPKPAVAEADQADPDAKGELGAGDDGKGPAKSGATSEPDSVKGEGDGATKAPADGGDNDSSKPETPPSMQAGDEGIPSPGHPAKWLTIGSYDGSVPGVHAITLTTRGAGVVRWELTERDDKDRLVYRELMKKGGYLGVTAGADSVNGYVVEAISPGSPASAMLRVGDTIQAVEQMAIITEGQINDALAEHRAGDSVELTILRDGSAQKVAVDLSARPLELIRPELMSTGEVVGDPPSFRVSIRSVDGKKVDVGNPILKPFHRLRTDHWKVESSTPSELVLSYHLPQAAFDLMTPNSGATDAKANETTDGEKTDGEETGSRDGVTIRKRFRIPKEEAAIAEDVEPLRYRLLFDVELLADADFKHKVELEVEGPNGVTNEGWWYQNKIHPTMFKSAGARDVVASSKMNGRMFRGTGEISSHAKKNPQNPVSPFVGAQEPEDARLLRYLAVDTQYFVVAMQSAEPGELMPVTTASPEMLGDAENLNRARLKTINTRFVAALPAAAPGENTKMSFAIFAGPKRPELLTDYKLDSILEYGWFWFISKPLAMVLHGLYAVVRNYGLAIIMLTVLVRFLMMPLGRKAAQNAMMMQQLAPEQAAIKEKYKGDMQKMGEAQRELYAKYGFNPLSGCLPMFIQLPIFLGLYRCLSVDINLRQAPLIPGVEWCSNLAAPDQFLNWSSYLPQALAGETGWLGPYLNILPIFTIVLFLVQQKMFTPPAQDEQQELQQKIMMYMMIFIGVMFFKVPAGLCIYFITSSVWGIFERKLMPKPELKTVPGGLARGSSSKPSQEQESGMEPSKAALVARERAKQRRRGRKN